MIDISPEQLWQQVLNRLQLQLSQPTFETWIRTASAESVDEKCLVIRTPNHFAKNWLQKHYLKTISGVVKDVLGQTLEIRFTVGDQDISLEPSPDANWLSSANPIIENNPQHNHPRATKLNPKYVFSRFVVGANNRMAHAASLAVAESPGREFNPLFICGGVGLGKTHLMQAIGHYRLEISPIPKSSTFLQNNLRMISLRLFVKIVCKNSGSITERRI